MLLGRLLLLRFGNAGVAWVTLYEYLAASLLLDVVDDFLVDLQDVSPRDYLPHVMAISLGDEIDLIRHDVWAWTPPIDLIVKGRPQRRIRNRRASTAEFIQSIRGCPVKTVPKVLLSRSVKPPRPARKNLSLPMKVL